MNLKKIFTIILTTTFIFLMSCSKDDNPVSSEDQIVGTWVLTKLILPNYGNMELTPEQAGISLTFKMKSDKTFEVIIVESGTTTNDSGTWNAANGKLTMKSKSGEEETFDYTIQGNKLRVTTQMDIENLGNMTVIMEFTKQ